MLLRSALPSDSSFLRSFGELYDPALVIDPTNGEILVANRAAIALLCYNPEELGRLTPSDIHPRELPRMDAFLAAVRAHGRWAGDDRNTLATAQLVADGLAEHPDQRVGRRAEAITRSIERSVSMCRLDVSDDVAYRPRPRAATRAPTLLPRRRGGGRRGGDRLGGGHRRLARFSLGPILGCSLRPGLGQKGGFAWHVLW